MCLKLPCLNKPSSVLSPFALAPYNRLQLPTHLFIFHVPLWAPAPRPAPGSAGRPPTSPLASFPIFRRRRPHKGEVNLDRLIEKFRIICAFDGGFGFFLRGVFD